MRQSQGLRTQRRVGRGSEQARFFEPSRRVPRNGRGVVWFGDVGYAYVVLSCPLPDGRLKFTSGEGAISVVRVEVCASRYPLRLCSVWYGNVTLLPRKA